jgi:hypothetical protein
MRRRRGAPRQGTFGRIDSDPPPGGYLVGMRSILPLGVVCTLALAALPAPALADQFERVYQDFKDDGEIDGCRYSDGELAAAEGQIPPDIEQYAPSFAEQLAAAREKRASGACDPKPAARRRRRAEPAPAPAAAPPPARRGPRPAAPVPEPPGPSVPPRRLLPEQVDAPAASAPAALAERGGDAPAPVWVLAVLAALALLGGAAGAVAWLRGWSPERFTRPLAAAAGEAGDRTASLAGEFWDWLRLGR